MLDYITIITNLYTVTGPNDIIWATVHVFCYLMAGVMALVFCLQMKEVAESVGRITYRAPVMTFFATAMFAAAPEAVQTFAATFYTGWESGGPLSTLKDPGPGSFSALMRLISLVGYVFFVRGIVLLKESGQPERYPQATFSKAFITMTAGMAAIYMDITLKVIANTTGWNISNYIN